MEQKWNTKKVLSGGLNNNRVVGYWTKLQVTAARVSARKYGFSDHKPASVSIFDFERVELHESQDFSLRSVSSNDSAFRR